MDRASLFIGLVYKTENHVDLGTCCTCTMSITLTPVKQVDPDCIFCLSSTSWRTYKIKSKYCTERNFVEKVNESITDISELPGDSAVCSKCITKFDKLWEFRSSARDNILQQLHSRERIKRLHRTPTTPEQDETPRISRVIKKSRKVLQLDSPAKSTPLPTPIEQIAHEVS